MRISTSRLRTRIVSHQASCFLNARMMKEEESRRLSPMGSRFAPKPDRCFKLRARKQKRWKGHAVAIWFIDLPDEVIERIQIDATQRDSRRVDCKQLAPHFFLGSVQTDDDNRVRVHKLGTKSITEYKNWGLMGDELPKLRICTGQLRRRYSAAKTVLDRDSAPT